jgi:hypothetical protein
MTVIYNRVYTTEQNNDSNLKNQENNCYSYAEENNLCIRSVYKEVNNTTTKIPPVLNTVLKLHNRVILIPDILTFAQSVNIGLASAKIAIKNSNTIIFIKENFMCRILADLSKLEQYLQNNISKKFNHSSTGAEPDSEIFDFDVYDIPYGFEINMQLIPCEVEQDVITFIHLCKNSSVKSLNLNNQMRTILNNLNRLNDIDKVNIKCYDDNDMVVSKQNKSMSNTDIIDILNTYNITNRDKQWKPNMVDIALLGWSRNPQTIRTAVKDALRRL